MLLHAKPSAEVVNRLSLKIVEARSLAIDVRDFKSAGDFCSRRMEDGREMRGMMKLKNRRFWIRDLEKNSKRGGMQDDDCGWRRAQEVGLDGGERDKRGRTASIVGEARWESMFGEEEKRVVGQLLRDKNASASTTS